jgi:hypothetical protein
LSTAVLQVLVEPDRAGCDFVQGQLRIAGTEHVLSSLEHPNRRTVPELPSHVIRTSMLRRGLGTFGIRRGRGEKIEHLDLSWAERSVSRLLTITRSTFAHFVFDAHVNVIK